MLPLKQVTIKCLHFFGNRAQPNRSIVNFNTHNSVLNLLSFVTIENEEQLAMRQKTWNESLGGRKDNEKNFPSSPSMGAGGRTREGVHVSRLFQVVGRYQLTPLSLLHLLSYYPLPVFLLLVPITNLKVFYHLQILHIFTLITFLLPVFD